MEKRLTVDSEYVRNPSSRVSSVRFASLELAQEIELSYQADWFGVPIIQYPADIFGIQSLLLEVKPTLVIETGIARGGSVMLTASMLALIELEATLLSGEGNGFRPSDAKRRVVAIDIDIRDHANEALDAFFLRPMIHLIRGDSSSDAIAAEVHSFVRPDDVVLVILDSNHTLAHVAAELAHYAPLVSPGSYVLVCDTVIEQLPEGQYPDRDWGPGNSPQTAVSDFLSRNGDFEVDNLRSVKLMTTAHPGGFLRRKEIPKQHPSPEQN